MKSFQGRVAVVTGGASGIGLALARRFASEGMKVVIGDIEAPALDGAVAELKATGAEIEGVVTDVSDAEQVQALADAAVERFGAIHIACNNAGVGGGGLSWEAPLSTWEWVLGVNLWGVIHGLRSFTPILMQQDEAHMVNTASMAGLIAAPFMAPYNASKHAVVAISESLHHEMTMNAPQVHVSVLCPGWVNTKIYDAARNRPEHLQTDAEGLSGDLLKGILADGMPPEEVAGKVFAAIRHEQFWILTHDDVNDVWKNAVLRRTKALEDRTNPQFSLG